ncbi:MAG: Ig-like domain-containing protein, partial [Leptospiraceae bacterium]|nr:Ig-like domain-containing protein [Leptospiraceae bacterium]
MKTLKSTMILFFLFSQLTFCTSDKKKNDTIVLLGLIAITKQANPKSSDPNSSSQGDGGAPQTEGSNGGDGSGGGSSGGVELPAQQNTPIISMVSSSPGNGEEATKWNKSILITFDKNVTKPNGNISITVGGNNVTFTSEVNDKVLKLTVTSDVDLNNDQTVSVVILKEAIENLNENYSFSFTAKATYQAISSVKY